MYCQPEPTHRFSEPKKDRYPYESKTEKMIYRPTSEHFFSHPNSNTRSTCSHLFLFSNSPPFPPADSSHPSAAAIRDAFAPSETRSVGGRKGKNKKHINDLSTKKDFDNIFIDLYKENANFEKCQKVNFRGTKFLTRSSKI